MYQKAYEDIFKQVEDEIYILDGMLRRDEPPHTKEIAHLPFCYSGKLTGRYYASAMLLGKLSEQQGLEILTALEKLQIRDEQSEMFGAFRWYREETKINDTNGAFFILMPLVFLELYYPEIIPLSHHQIIKSMFEYGYHWFLRECNNPMLYYSNKIMSDGALLLGISTVIKCEDGIKTAIAFWERWNEYTDRRGWGWGENTSLGYIQVILDAFHLTLRAMGNSETVLKKNLSDKMKDLIDYTQFHGGREFVPSIRTYNMDGQCFAPSVANAMAGVRFWYGDMNRERRECILSSIISLALSQEQLKGIDVEFTDNPKAITPNVVQPFPRIRNERVFDDAYAYTWIGEHCRLGSINKFPVIPGCYQWPTWGLGWQTMPVSFLVEDEQTSFLRFSVKEHGNHRTHIAINHHSSYLNPALFGETCLPDVETKCIQNENILVSYRKISNLSNSASEILDEWIIQRFDGEVHKLEINNRNWVVLEYKNCYVAICSLNGIDYDYNFRKELPLTVIQEDGSVRISHVLYSGEEKYLRQHSLESAWITALYDDKPTFDEISKRLNELIITDISRVDNEVPRSDFQKIREITCANDIGNSVNLHIDPHTNF